MKGFVSLKKEGFILDQRKRKDWANSKNIFIRKSVVNALINAKKMLPKGHNFKIFDGKRSIAEQKRIINICEKDFKKRFPNDWEKRLIDFTGGYASLKMKLPKDTHRHGGAIDLTIVDSKEKELDMGGDIFNKTMALNYYEGKNNLTKREKKIKLNRRFLKRIMTQAGFKPHLPEWAHWGYAK
jgi:D-alanyl-D-alanine dipeptidase